ncbi:MAG: T9SS type B sorting domain-containing protein [Capnocytophaga sp.]|nr:T9SS type B sorting domain-containing protein [Capnocytophaga sp.]MBB1569054.1 T9SS type B sorting domain-containing protein [Capnocytophaga sp.]
MKKNLITGWLLLTAGVGVYSQANQSNPNNITIDRENSCEKFMMEVFPDKGNCSAQILNVYAWGVKENEEISWQLLDNAKVSKASGTFTTTQTRNVPKSITLPILPAGAYTFVARIASCPTKPREYSINYLQAPLQMNLSEIQHIDCNSKLDKGKVHLQVSGGEKDSYTYGYQKIEEGSKPTALQWQKDIIGSDSFITLDEGKWYIYVMDPRRGCVVSNTVTINRYPTPSISSIIPQPCNARTDAKVPVRITLAQLGQGKHYYQLNREPEQLIQFAENNTFLLNVLPNIYKIRIRDEKNCSAYENFEVHKPIAATVTFTSVSCGEFPADFPIFINVKGGKKAYNYTVTQLNTNEKPSSGDLKEGDNQVFIFSPKAGTYRFQIYDSETTNCPITKDIELKKNSPIQVNAAPLYSKDCTQENGEIALHISGGQAPYKVRLVNQVTKEELSQTLNSSVHTFTGVIAGNYTIEVQDAAGCNRYEGTTSVTVQPSFVLKDISFETIKKATCERKEEVLVKVAVTPEYVKETWLKYIITSEDKKYKREIRLNDTTLHLNGTEALGVGKYHIEVINEQTQCNITQDYEVKSVAEDYTLVVGTPIRATCSSGKGLLTLSIQNKKASATKVSVFDYRITANSVVTGTSTNGSAMIRLSAGSYQIEVTVAETGCKLYGKVIMPETPATIQVTATPLYSKDCTQENGEIALHISGGQAPYKVKLVHQVSKQELTQTLSSSVYTFTGVTAGNYTIEVQDAAGCSRYEGTTSVTVQPSFVLKNISFETIKKATCERKEKVLVKVAVTPEYVKGTWLKYIITSEDKKYRREIRLDDTTLHLNGAEALGVGKYHIEVINEQTQCNIAQDYEVKSVAEDYALVVGTPVRATCSSGKGQLTLSVAPKEGTLAKISGFSYRLTAGSTVVTGTTTDNNTTLQLPAGFYQIEVTVTETGCKLYDKVLMPEPPATIQVSATPLYSKDCTQENGEIALQISGGQAPYKVKLVHQVSKQELTQTLNSSVYTFTGVTAGSYTIEVQDAAGCSRYEGTTSVTVQPSFVLKNISFETLKKATCERKEEVLVKVAVTPEYVKGTWLKYIITSEDKKYRKEIRLDDTTLHLNEAEALGVGKYHIEVLNEQTQCSIGEDYEVKSVAEDYRLVVGTPIKATCSSGKGLLTLSIQNKEASATKVSAFDYRITANSVVTGTSTNGSAMIRLSAGSYQIEVTVAETGCKLYGKVIMPEPPVALKLATTVQASANCEDAKGAAIVQVSGGISPYTITLTHKRTGAVYSETNVGVGANAITLNFSDLKSGYYYAHVQDTAGCEAMGSVTIEEYTPIVLSKLNAETIAPSCGDANDGKLIFEVQVSGGVPPYKYKLEKKTEKTSEHTLITVTNGRGYIENLSSGSYQLLVEDSKNCIATITETTIIAPKPITVDIKVNKSHSQACDDSQNGSVTLSNIAGGSGFYRIYLINHEKKTVVDRKIGVKAGETVTFGNLASSYNIHYEIAIQDSKGCLLAHLAPFTIDEEPDVAVQSVENEINCDPTSNKGYVHTLVVKFNNNVVDYDKISYNLNNGTERLFTRTAGNIAFIDDFDAETLTQTLTVNYKPMGVGRPICPASIVNFSLTRFPQFTLERVPNDDLNVIEVIAKGGVTDLLSGYTYYFNGENQGNNPVYTIKNTDPERIEAGGVRIKTIEVKAKDAKDCIRTLVVEVPYIDIDIPNYFTPNGDGDNDRWRPKKMEDFPNAFVHVFDRNGRRMATLKPGESWDGIYAGKPMPSGDYWYTIDLNDELRDGRKIYGHFSLYR